MKSLLWFTWPKSWANLPSAKGRRAWAQTELSKAWAGATGRRLIRLQCYEGLDETKALYEWEYAKQMLYTQLLRDKLQDVVGSVKTLREAADRIAAEEEVFFSERFLLPRPLLQALTSPDPVVLLIDEIDRADVEFEAFLLEVLSDFQVSVPELGTLSAVHRPLVILTNNNTRELSEALKRRCLYLFIGYPTIEQELAFLVMAKEGSTISGFADAFAQGISYALQYGVPLQVLVDKFSHVRFEPSGMTRNAEVRFAKSIVDYVFRWMATKFLSPEAKFRAGVNMEEPHAVATVVASHAPANAATVGEVKPATAAQEYAAIQNQEDAPPCPTCGSIMIRNGACYKCANCGTTSGCA